MKYYLESPDYIDEGLVSHTPNFYNESIFLAGSIIGNINWQESVAFDLGKYFHVFNPRRMLSTTESLEERNIGTDWEYYYLRKVKNILFWFNDETVAPITLFELGAALERNNQNLYIGCHPKHKRINEIRHQVSKFGYFVQEHIEDLLHTVKFDVGKIL